MATATPHNSFGACRMSWIRLAILLIILLLAVPVGLVAFGSGIGLVPLPFEMHLLAKRLPYIFHTHMLTGAAVLLLAPITIAARHRSRLHRMLGRILGAFVVVSGLTALLVAIISSSPVMARAGFFAQGITWLGLLAAAYSAIRRGDRRRHAHLMLAMVAVTSGAIWFRLLTGSAILLQLPFSQIYAAAAWIGWLLPLAAVLSAKSIVQRFVSS